MGLYSFHLFAGAGGGILADRLLGHKTIGVVEIEEYPRKVLLARQLDGNLPRFPIWDDVTTFRFDNPATTAYIRRLREIRGELVICGGFPCQDISAAGKGEGIEGSRSGLWMEMARIIGEVRPRYAFVENSPILTSRGLGVVLGDLAEMGFNARWGVLGAAEVGAPHLRERIWIVADSKSYCDYQHVGKRGIQNKRTAVIRYAYMRDKEIRCETWKQLVLDGGRMAPSKWRAEGYFTDPRPLLLRNDDGLASGMERLGVLGNGQVPQCAAEAWRILSE